MARSDLNRSRISVGGLYSVTIPGHISSLSFEWPASSIAQAKWWALCRCLSRSMTGSCTLCRWRGSSSSSSVGKSRESRRWNPWWAPATDDFPVPLSLPPVVACKATHSCLAHWYGMGQARSTSFEADLAATPRCRWWRRVDSKSVGDALITSSWWLASTLLYFTGDFTDGKQWKNKDMLLRTPHCCQMGRTPVTVNQKSYYIPIDSCVYSHSKTWKYILV